MIIKTTLLFVPTLWLLISFPTTPYGLAQETDPLGRVIPKTTENKDTAKSTASDSGLPKRTPALGGTTGGSLREFVPQRVDRPQLPKTRDFEAEAEGRASYQIRPTTQDTDSSDSAQAENIRTSAAPGTLVDTAHGGFRMVKRSTQVWEFGLEITAAGPVTGIVASAPIPIEWPEQQLKVVSQFRSPTVGNVRMREFAGQGQQMIVAVPNLPAGQTARATMTIELERFDIVSLEHPQQWQFVPKGSRAGRDFLGPSPYIESTHRRIKELANEIVDESQTPWEQVESIYKWVQTNIQYEFDPTIHSCLQALDSQKGDCEEMASLFIALCRARKIPARAVWCNDHTYPEFLMALPDGTEVWLPCQITTHEHVFGQMFDDRPILQKGDKFSILGEAQPARYLKPAMEAKSAVGSPEFKWIIQQVDSTKPDSSPLNR